MTFINEIVIGKLIETALEKSVDFIVSVANRQQSEVKPELLHGLSLHLRKVINFSQTISIFKLPDTKEIEEHSIHLDIYNQHRKFSNISNKKLVTEEDLIWSSNHRLLLGDVGSGKTTTIKRLINKTFQVLHSEESERFPFSVPLFFKLGEIEPTETLTTHICHQIGLAYDRQEHRTKTSQTKIKRVKILNEETGEERFEDREYDVEVEKITYSYKIGDQAIELVVGDYLNRLNCIAFFDGLDEVHFGIKERVFAELKQLSRVLVDSKCILTSRHLSEIGSFKQYETSEICPLTKGQKLEISHLWFKNPQVFLKRVKKLPYADLADRPLFLTYLILLYKGNNDELPLQSVDVYRQIVLLVIREWDDDKEIQINRYSKYKSFDTYKKEDFLSELTFELTYNQKVKKSFSHRQLEVAYLNVFKRYPVLGLNDAKLVVQDIESHNGLIIETQNTYFEFSHLSLQEYLCAKYLLTVAFSTNHYELMNIYAAPFAIATVLSPRPAEWFANFFLFNVGIITLGKQLKPDSVHEYLNRLITENVAFSKPSSDLGLAIIFLKDKFDSGKVSETLRRFCSIKYVYESLELAAKFYDIKIYDEVHLKLRNQTTSELMIEPLKSARISKINFWRKR